MKEGPPLLLAAYDLAWRLAWGPLRSLAALDGLAVRLRGRGFLPRRWRAESRLADPRPGETGGLPTVWLHGASLGESKGLWALAQVLAEGWSPGGSGKKEEREFRILLTAVTAEGADFLRERAAGWEKAEEGREPGTSGIRMAASLAPLDHPIRVERFLRAHRVAYVVLYEAELWPNHIRVPARLGLPVDLVSARMSERAFRRAHLLGKTWGSLLDRLGWIVAQGETDAGRFRSLSRAPVTAGGDFKTRHYLLSDAGAGAAAPRDLERIAFISLHRGELDLLLPELPALMRRFPITIFPRQPGEMEAFRLALVPLGFRRHAEEPGARHVLVDALGMVGRLLPACGSAFVGGTWVPFGGHNPWEPLRAGLKVAMGPSTFNQEEPVRLALAQGLVTVLRGPADLRGWVAPDPGHAERCRSFVAERVRFLEESEAVFRRRAADAVAGFYLFSGAAKDTLSS